MRGSAGLDVDTSLGLEADNPLNDFFASIAEPEDRDRGSSTKFEKRIEKRQGGCKANTMLFARGTTEMGSMGSTVGPLLSGKLGSQWTVENQKYTFENFKSLGAFESAEDFSAVNLVTAINKCFKNGYSTTERFIPVYTLHGHTFIVPHLRIKQPVTFIIYRIMQVKPLAAKHPLINRVIFVAGKRYAAIFFLVNNHATANPAITAGTG